MILRLASKYFAKSFSSPGNGDFEALEGAMQLSSIYLARLMENGFHLYEPGDVDP